jgi:hypothetical protein
MENKRKLFKLKEAVDPRPHHSDLLAAIEDGFVDYETVAKAALAYMSDDDIADMCKANDFMIGTDELDEKLVDPSEEDIKGIEAKLADLGLEIEGKGETPFGNTHYQLKKELDHNVTKEDLAEIFDGLCNLSTDELHVPCNVGIHYKGDNIISASIDILKKSVNEQLKADDDDGWGEDVREVTADFFDKVERMSYEVQNARRGVYGVSGDSVEDLANDFEEISREARDLGKWLYNESDRLDEAVAEYIDKDEVTGASIYKVGDRYVASYKGTSHQDEDYDKLLDKLHNHFELGVKKLQNLPEEKIQEAIISEEDVAKALADYLDLDVEDVSIEGGYVYETPAGDYYAGTDDEMHDLAVEYEVNLIDDMGLDLFTQSFRNQILKDTDMFDASWFTEYWEEYNDSVDEEDKIEVGSDYDAVQLYIDTFGEDAFERAAEPQLNKEAIAEEVITYDGISNILATYDGDEVDLGGGLYAYRFN